MPELGPIRFDRGIRVLDFFVQVFFRPLWRLAPQRHPKPKYLPMLASRRDGGKEGKRERIPPPFSSGIPEEREKGINSSIPSFLYPPLRRRITRRVGAKPGNGMGKIVAGDGQKKKIKDKKPPPEGGLEWGDSAEQVMSCVGSPHID